ncbi:hypothetical protein D9757_004523 [Collybiopsis confluens]|uniref:Uncharacterized protein n=1 Tax=Collybiopsis confluens TaxID=2823264 RepID=A0A8H5MEA3_9AGAR|nr:hypothetical protein D9757_004523 [Collybiopsis confluens]
MIELPYNPPASPHGALLKTTAEDAEGLLDNPQRHAGNISLQSNVLGGYLEIPSVFLLAVIIACMNHAMFAHLHGQEPGNHTSQFWVTVLKNVFPAAVAFLLFMGLKICLSQVALYYIRRNSYPLELVNLITSPLSLLNTLSILIKSSMQISILCFALLTIVAQAVALTSLFVPGTLTVVAAPSRLETLAVSNIDFTVVNPTQSSSYQRWSSGGENTTAVVMSFLEPSQRWQQLIVRAASGTAAPTWDPPIGCGSACSYSFSYVAPTLNCTQLSKEDIWPSGQDSTSDTSLLLFGKPKNSLFAFHNFFLYNSTVTSSIFSQFSQFDVIYMANFSSTELTNEIMSTNSLEINQSLWSPRGVHCSYQNATYETTTKFFNNTQLSSTQVKEWGALIPWYANGPVIVGDEDSANEFMAFNSIIQSFNQIIQGSAAFDGASVQTSGTQVFSTPLFELNNSLVLNPEFITSTASASNFSLSPAFQGNLSAGLQELLGNVTLAFVNEKLATTYADVMVTPNNTEYQYTGWKLGLIYGVVFGLSLVVITFGLFCLHQNGIVAVFDMTHIIEMTADRLHESAVQPDLGSMLVTGVSSFDTDGMRRRRVGLDVSSSS